MGGGHGAYSIALCRRHPQLMATVFDLPEALKAARENVAAEGLEDRIELREGDFLTEELPTGYDVALLFNIVHGFEAEQNAALLQNVAAALDPGGLVAVVEQVTGRAPGPASRAFARHGPELLPPSRRPDLLLRGNRGLADGRRVRGPAPGQPDQGPGQHPDPGHEGELRREEVGHGNPPRPDSRRPSLFRDGMRGLLSTQPDMEVAGEAATGEEAVKLVGELEPDVVLMDIKMPGLGGIEATRRILMADPGVRVLVVTMFEDDATVFTAMRAGARGYVLKDDDKDDVLGAIRTVGRGGAVFGPGVATRLTDFLTTTRPTVPRESFPALTDREREMLHLIAKGASNVEISRLLALSPKTVANYVSNILHKLRVADRKEAALRAREAGMGQEDRP